jgi:predicted transposase/invertase (TIGR01784 family)
MWAERAASKIDRDYEKAARRMNAIKASMDLAQLKYDAREEGRQEGREEGILEIARKMKEIGDPVEKIQTITGLSAENIEQI